MASRHQRNAGLQTQFSYDTHPRLQRFLRHQGNTRARLLHRRGQARCGDRDLLAHGRKAKRQVARNDVELSSIKRFTDLHRKRSRTRQEQKTAGFRGADVVVAIFVGDGGRDDLTAADELHLCVGKAAAKRVANTAVHNDRMGCDG